jgi:hypothetical protein
MASAGPRKQSKNTRDRVEENTPGTRSADEAVAHDVMPNLAGDSHGPRGPATVLPPGPWRAELAYRSVLQRPATFELLESLSPSELSAALQQAGLTTTDTPLDKLDALATSTSHGGPPNPLWLAWIRNVHASRLTQD